MVTSAFGWLSLDAGPKLDLGVSLEAERAVRRQLQWSRWEGTRVRARQVCQQSSSCRAQHSSATAPVPAIPGMMLGTLP